MHDWVQRYFLYGEFENCYKHDARNNIPARVVRKRRKREKSIVYFNYIFYFFKLVLVFFGDVFCYLFFAFCFSLNVIVFYFILYNFMLYILTINKYSQLESESGFSNKINI